MRKKCAIFTASLLGCLSAVAQQAQPNIPKHLIVTIDTQQSADPVSKYLFGSFIEHIGTLIYRSIWAELLDDRKFYFPISSKNPEPPRTQSGNPMRQQLHKWRPIGPDDILVMDTDQPFVGDHSPKISLDAATPHGIRQAGFSVVSGKQYTGRI
jgi:alpha-L-arabinofuranosidase